MSLQIIYWSCICFLFVVSPLLSPVGLQHSNSPHTLIQVILDFILYKHKKIIVHLNYETKYSSVDGNNSSCLQSQLFFLYKSKVFSSSTLYIHSLVLINKSWNCPSAFPIYILIFTTLPALVVLPSLQHGKSHDCRKITDWKAASATARNKGPAHRNNRGLWTTSVL